MIMLLSLTTTASQAILYYSPKNACCRLSHNQVSAACVRHCCAEKHNIIEMNDARIALDIDTPEDFINAQKSI